MMAVVIRGRILINVTRYVSQVANIAMVLVWILGVTSKGGTNCTTLELWNEAYMDWIALLGQRYTWNETDAKMNRSDHFGHIASKSSPTNLPSTLLIFSPSTSPSNTHRGPTAVSPTRIPTVHPTKMPTSSTPNSPTETPTAIPIAVLSEVLTESPTEPRDNLQTIIPTRFQSPTVFMKIIIFQPDLAELGFCYHAVISVRLYMHQFCKGTCSTYSKTIAPSLRPSISPSQSPTGSPTSSPTQSPTITPTKSPSSSPTHSIALSPSTTRSPTIPPSKMPTTTSCNAPTELHCE